MALEMSKLIHSTTQIYNVGVNIKWFAIYTTEAI